MIYVSGLCNVIPTSNALYGIWWGNDHQLSLSRNLQGEQNLQQVELEAVLAAIFSKNFSKNFSNLKKLQFYKSSIILQLQKS